MRTVLLWMIANPAVVILFVAVAVLGGVLAALHLPMGLFPGLDVPVVNVISHYPATAADDMDLMITRPIEARIRAIPGATRVASTSIEGVSQVTVQFEWGTRLADARQLVQAQLSAVQPSLPIGVTPRLESIGTTLQEVVGYVVYGAGDPVELRTIARMQLATRLMDVDGVSRVEILGGDEPAFVVHVRNDALARTHLTVSDVMAALAAYNVTVATDFIDRGSREYVIRGDSRLKTIQDVEAVPLIAQGADSVLLRDVATVEAGRTPRHYQVHGNAVPAVALVVYKQPAANTVAVVRGVDRQLAQLARVLPAGARVRKFYDQADIVSEARSSLFQDLVVGAVLAGLVLFLFMGTIRATLIVAAAIPIALLATLALMRAFGQTLNVITLSALTLAVGMVVDDAIVVAENIVRHVKTGVSRACAGAAGAAEIAGPDVSGTLTTVAAFAPLLFVSGIAGLFVRPFGLVVSLSLLASLAASLTLVPVLFGHVGVPSDRRALGAGLLAGLDRMLQSVLKFALAHKGVVVVLGLCSMGLAALGAWLGPVRVLPPIDEGAILIEYVMPPGTSLTESNRIGEILEQEALARPDVATVYRRTGSPGSGLQIEGVNRGELTIKLAPRSVRRHSLDQIMERLRKRYSEIPGVAFLYHQPTQEKMDESLSGIPALFGVTIFGPDNAKLVSLAAEAESLMAKDPALTDIINNTKVRSPQIIVRPDPVELARCDLTPADVFRTIQAGRFGVLATTIIDERQRIPVLVKVESPPRATLEWLKGLTIPTRAGQVVPLERVADVRVAHLPPAVTRLNGQREVTILADVGGSIPAAVDRLTRAFGAIDLPTGYNLAFTGEYQVMRRTIRDFVLIGCAALILIYLIMAIQFRSWLQPLIILATVPFALVGAIVLLVVTRVGLDVSAGIGALTLAGIAVNNAIVLLDYANRRVADGMASHDALRQAASVRLRPILMTAATTVLALVPVAVNPAVGSRIFQPFAVTVIGGLLSSTLASMVLVPVLAAGSARRRPLETGGR